jgi:hypothetical protein
MHNVCEKIVMHSIWIIFILLFSPVYASNFNYQTGDLIVDGDDFVEVHNYLQDGNIIVKDRGTLLISNGTFRILQDYDYQYILVVKDYGTVKIQNATFIADCKFSMVAHNSSTIHIINSNINFPGFINLFCKEVVVQAGTITVDSITMAGSIKISYSTLSTETNVTFKSAELTVKYTEFQYGLIMRDASYAELVDVVTPEIRCYDSSVAYIYRTVHIAAKDRIGMPLKAVCINFIEPISYEIVQTTYTDASGTASVELLSDIIDISTYPSSQYVGNYIVQAIYLEYLFEKELNLPYYRIYNISAVPPLAYIEIRFEFTDYTQTVWEIYEKTDNDLVVEGNTTEIIENTMAVHNRYIHTGNIWLKHDAKLIVRRNTELFIDQMYDYEFCILVEDNAALMLQNAYLKSNHRLTVYLLDNGCIQVANGTVNVDIIHGYSTSEIEIYASEITASKIDIEIESIKLSSANIKSEYCKIVAHTAHIYDTELNVTALTVDTSILTVFNSTFAVPLQIYKGIAHLISVDAPEIIVQKNATIYEGWLVTINVVNGRDRPVADAEVMVFQNTPSFGEDIVASAITDSYGRATVALTARIITSVQSLFIGNYKFVAYFFQNNIRYESEKQLAAIDTDKNITLRFKEPLIPPFTITPVVTVAPNVTMPNGTIAVVGEVLYNEGPDRVVGAEVRIVIVETGEYWTLTTDSYGRFNITFNAPLVEGEYKVEITVYDPFTDLSGSTSMKIKVEVEAKVLFDWNIIFIIIAIACGMTIIYLAILYVKKRMMIKKLIPVSEEVKRKAAIRWLVKSMVERKR